MWQDKKGNLYSYEDCKNEYKEYKEKNIIDNYKKRPDIIAMKTLSKKFYSLIHLPSKIKNYLNHYRS